MAVLLLFFCVVFMPMFASAQQCVCAAVHNILGHLQGQMAVPSLWHHFLRGCGLKSLGTPAPTQEFSKSETVGLLSESIKTTEPLPQIYIN